MNVLREAQQSAGWLVHKIRSMLMSTITYLRVSFVLQVEHEKQLTHQALLRADTTEGITLTKENMNICTSTY